jgi:peptidoglycan/xylan/chitin deacetylase (PgdA/CDA1 family)
MALARFATLALIVALSAAPQKGLTQESAVAVVYHQLGNVSGATTSLQNFDNHLAVLSTAKYEVLSLPQILNALRGGIALPEYTIAITFDGAHTSIYEEAWPRLRALGLPFTVFVATDLIDSEGQNYMSWDQLRELSSAGVNIGSLGRVYGHLATEGNPEKAADDISFAQQKFIEELGGVPELFAYPFGEHSSSLQELVARHGHAAAFGQHSGVLHSKENFLALPRYPLIANFSDLARFQTVIDSLPLPVTDLVPTNPLIQENPPILGFTISSDLGPLQKLACYLARSGRLNLEHLGPTRIEVRFSQPLEKGRSRINCTLPGPNGRWRWFGMQLLVP